MPASSSGAPMPPVKHAPWVVALTGGVGSGKSTVARVFVGLGGRHIDADAIAHEVTATAEIRKRLQRQFGAATVAADGTLDRQYLSDHVFGCADAPTRESRIAQLNAIVHPAVRAKIDKTLEMWEQRGFDEASPLPMKRPLVILDIPLLERSPYPNRASAILFIESSLEDRLQRVRESRGWTEERLREREAAQAALSEKRMFATHVLANPNLPESGSDSPSGGFTARGSDALGSSTPSREGYNSAACSLEAACRVLIKEWSAELAG